MEPCSSEIEETHPLSPKWVCPLIRETNEPPSTQTWPQTSPPHRLFILLWSPEPQREAERTEIAPTFQGEKNSLVSKLFRFPHSYHGSMEPAGPLKNQNYPSG